MKYQYSPLVNSVKVCKLDSCIEAKGNTADLIAGAAAVMLLFVGIAAIAGAMRWQI